MILLWIEFLICSAVIVYCGANLSRYGDVIAEKTGLGRAWIGLILMSGVTSLPELITGISSVAFADAPDIAMGDVMGSCVFNLSLIALMDMLHGPHPIFSKAEHSHILSAGFGAILMGIAVLSIASGTALPAIGHISIATPVIVGFYALSMRSVFLFQKRQVAEHIGEIAPELQYGSITTREAAIKYGLNALVIVIAASWLPFIGDRLAEVTGLGRSFVGSILIAMTTSLPELVVSITALRIGAADMAIANLMGSNLFNMVILGIDDMAYAKGALFSAVSQNHAITGTIAVIMTGIVIVSLMYRLEKKTVLRIGWDALALALAYLVNIALLYSLRGRG
ncbi:MAG: sodium:calcium antiporter [Nitrospirota bacterium]|nr:sodium:calcium antiporter [Nitrospirota bacterium]